MEQELINLLKEQELTRDFTESELSELAGLVKTRHYKAGEVIIEEGEKISSIYFLPRGEVDVLKYDDKRENLFTILTLKEGSFFGEMSFVDKEPTSATIRTRTDCTIWVLSKKEVESLPLYDKLIKNIAVCEINRLRATNKDYVKSLQLQLKESKLRNDFGRFFIVIIILFCIFNFIPNTAAESPIKQMLLSWGSLIFILIPIVYFVTKILTPISTFGITIDGWKRAVLEGILVSAVLILSLTLLKYFSTPADEPLVTWGTRAQSSRTDLYIYFGLYVMHSFIQEFIARGVIQGSLQRFMSDSHYMVPILLASLICAISHLHISLIAALLTFIGSVITGFFYYRHKNLIGITIMHYNVGVVAIAFGYI